MDTKNNISEKDVVSDDYTAVAADDIDDYRI